MAVGVSGYLDFAATKGFTLRVNYSEVYDIGGNTSTVTLTSIQIKGSQYWNNTYYLDGTISVNGITAVDMNSQIGDHGAYIGSKETWVTVTGSLGSVSGIAHDSNGSKSCPIAVSVYGYTQNKSNGHGWYASGTKNATLTTIARKSTMTVPNGTLGVSQTISVTKQDSSFKHTITYTCGNYSGAVCAGSTETSVSWIPPMDLALQNTTGTSVAVNFNIETISGSTLVGVATAAAVYQIPASVAPYMASTLTDTAGWYDSFGFYVQGQSKLGLTINASGSYGASIDSITTIFDGATYYGASVTSNPILQTGTVGVSITAKDSRGRTTTESPAIQVMAYSYPQLTAAESFRSNSNGDPDPKGTHITVKFSSSVTPLNNKNGAWYKVQYKTTTESSFTTVPLDIYTGKFTVTNGKYTFAADEGSYDIQILVGDRFKTFAYSVPGSAVEHTISMLKKNGKIVGMAFGKLAEYEGCIDFAWTPKFSGGGDCVIEEGVSGGWTYRLWDSGVAECWKTVQHSTTVATAWGGLYVGNAVARQNYPFTFAAKPVEIVSLTSGSKMGFLYPEQNGYGVNGVSASAQYNVCSLSSYTSAVTYYFNYHVMGRWK